MPKLKKNKYRLLGTKKVSIEHIYRKFKPHLEYYIQKYHDNNGDPVLFTNSTIAMFAKKYANIGTKIWDTYQEEPFVRENCEYYKCFDKPYMIRICKRIISVTDSIKSIGYLGGKHKKNLIGLVARTNDMGKVDGFNLISGKHRAAGCIANGMKKIKCNIYEEVA